MYVGFQSMSPSLHGLLKCAHCILGVFRLITTVRDCLRHLSAMFVLASRSEVGYQKD